MAKTMHFAFLAKAIVIVNIVISSSEIFINAQRSMAQDNGLTQPHTINSWYELMNSITSLRRTSPLLKNLPLKQLQHNSKIYNEDSDLHILELLTKYGQKPQRHQVITEDGYVLTLYRIPRNGPAVFLMHGLFCSADDWVTPGPERGIAYLLAEQGYDVWLGNARGTKHSRRHMQILPEEPDFWDFSWDEIGRLDLPAMIDYVLDITNQQQLRYVGHSQGTTSFFVMCSERPEYNAKISIMVALSPIAWMSHLKSPIIRRLSLVNPEVYWTLKLFGLNEIFPSDPFSKSLDKIFCGEQETAEKVCGSLVFMLCGFDPVQFDVPNLPAMINHFPSGSAMKQLVHYLQEIVSGKFRKFDYGLIKNLEVYGEASPPNYPVGKITAPVALFYSTEDWLSSPIDVEILKSKMSNVVLHYKVPYENFNHLDYIWARDIKTLIMFEMLKLFDVY